MDINCYSFYDVQSQMYDTPFHAESDLHAKRHFYIVANKPNTQIHTFTSSFELYLIGTFNTKTGIYIPAEKPLMVINGREIITAFKGETD